jgi:hypothetical protein
MAAGGASGIGSRAMDLPLDPGLALPGAAPMATHAGVGQLGVALVADESVQLEARAAWAPTERLVLRLEGELSVWARNGGGLFDDDPTTTLEQRLLVGVRWTPLEREWIHAGLYGRIGEWSAIGVGDIGLLAEGGWPFLRIDASLPLAYGAFGAQLEAVGLLPPQVWRTALEAGVSGRVAPGHWLRLGVTGGDPWMMLGWNGHFGRMVARIDVAADPGWGTEGVQFERLRLMLGERF